MNKVHISGYGSMLYFIYRSTFITLLLPFLITCKADAIWIVIIGSILGYFLLSIYLKIAKKNEHKNIIIGIDQFMKKGSGFILNTFIIIGICYFFGLLFTKLIAFTNTQYLRGTPIFFIACLFLFTIIFMGLKGIETISRACLLFLLLSLALLMIKFSGLYNQINFYHLTPIFETKPTHIIIGSVKYAITAVVPLFLLLLVPFHQITPRKKIIKKTKWFYFLTSIILFINIFLILTVLGPRLMLLYRYPEFHLLRNVKLLGFMNKLESILSIQWIIDMIICLSLCFVYIKTYILYYGKKIVSIFTAKV